MGFFFVHSQVLISSGKAVGVEYLQNGRREVVGANKEVILAAGPINSPHLLILSGVGPKVHLLDHKVACYKQKKPLINADLTYTFFQSRFMFRLYFDTKNITD